MGCFEARDGSDGGSDDDGSNSDLLSDVGFARGQCRSKKRGNGCPADGRLLSWSASALLCLAGVVIQTQAPGGGLSPRGKPRQDGPRRGISPRRGEDWHRCGSLCEGLWNPLLDDPGHSVMFFLRFHHGQRHGFGGHLPKEAWPALDLVRAFEFRWSFCGRESKRFGPFVDLPSHSIRWATFSVWFFWIVFLGDTHALKHAKATALKASFSPIFSPQVTSDALLASQSIAPEPVARHSALAISQ